MSLIFTEDAPTKPGWYFRRLGGADFRLQGGSVRMIDLTQCDVFPKHWKDVKQETLASMDASGDQEALNQLLARPDSTWLVEWAGPAWFDSFETKWRSDPWLPEYANR